MEQGLRVSVAAGGGKVYPNVSKGLGLLKLLNPGVTGCTDRGFVLLVLALTLLIACQTDEIDSERLAELEQRVVRLEEELRLEAIENPKVRVELRGVVSTDAIGMTWDGSITATSGVDKPCPPDVIIEMAERPVLEFGGVMQVLEENCTRVSVNVRRRRDNKPPSYDATIGFRYYIGGYPRRATHLQARGHSDPGVHISVSNP